MPTVPSEGLGKYTKAKAILHLKETVVPVFKHIVPFAVVESINKELGRLETVEVVIHI